MRPSEAECNQVLYIPLSSVVWSETELAVGVWAPPDWRARVLHPRSTTTSQSGPGEERKSPTYDHIAADILEQHYRLGRNVFLFIY